MKPVLRAVASEQVKLRGTLAWRLCFIAPALVVALCVLQLLLSANVKPMEDGAQAWQHFAQGVLVLWSFLMLPLYVTLQSALLAGLEHTERQWKHLLALPLPRSAHYLAKWMVLVAMVALAMAVLTLLVPLGGAVLMLSGNPLGLSGAPPWMFLLTRSAAILAASCFIISLHTWISIRWSSFTVAVATGMSATVAGFLIAQSARFGHLYPWSMPMHVLAGQGERIGIVVLAGMLGGAAVLLLGLADFVRRDPA
jgi:hypothetical protein